MIWVHWETWCSCRLWVGECGDMVGVEEGLALGRGLRICVMLCWASLGLSGWMGWHYIPPSLVPLRSSQLVWCSSLECWTVFPPRFGVGTWLPWSFLSLACNRECGSGAGSGVWCPASLPVPLWPCDCWYCASLLPYLSVLHIANLSGGLELLPSLCCSWALCCEVSANFTILTKLHLQVTHSCPPPHASTYTHTRTNYPNG